MPTCRCCGKPTDTPEDHDRPRDPEKDATICWAEDEDDCLEDMGVNVWDLVDELRAENARLRADLLSARQFGETMTPNPLLQRQPFADDPADRFKERDD